MSRAASFRFRLYIAGDAPNSAQAMFNLEEVCRIYLPKRHSVEIIDVFRDPQRALADGIFMTPTLIKLTPAPMRRIVGALSHTPTVLQTLGLDAHAE